MDFNPSKCEFLMITNKKLVLQFNYCINNQLIKEVQHVKYLGITIDSRLTWREHINVLSRKANSTLAFLRRNLRPCSSYTKAKTELPAYVMSGLSLNIHLLFGILISKKISISWRWYKEELLDLCTTTITLPIVLQTCVTIPTLAYSRNKKKIS